MQASLRAREASPEPLRWGGSCRGSGAALCAPSGSPGSSLHPTPSWSNAQVPDLCFTGWEMSSQKRLFEQLQQQQQQPYAFGGHSLPIKRACACVEKASAACCRVQHAMQDAGKPFILDLCNLPFPFRVRMPRLPLNSRLCMPYLAAQHSSKQHPDQLLHPPPVPPSTRQASQWCSLGCCHSLAQARSEVLISQQVTR